MLKTKSYWTVIDRQGDGLRILAARFRARGSGTTRYDVWMPSLAPSERILRKAQAGQMSWTEFVKAYKAEIWMDGPVDARCATIKNHGQKFTLRLLNRLAKRGNVTLMCLCAEDQPHCHRYTLLKEIQRSARCNACRCLVPLYLP